MMCIVCIGVASVCAACICGCVVRTVRLLPRQRQRRAQQGIHGGWRGARHQLLAQPAGHAQTPQRQIGKRLHAGPHLRRHGIQRSGGVAALHHCLHHLRGVLQLLPQRNAPVCLHGSISCLTFGSTSGRVCGGLLAG